MVRPVGWKYESARHALAARGIETGRRYNGVAAALARAGRAAYVKTAPVLARGAERVGVATSKAGSAIRTQTALIFPRGARIAAERAKVVANPISVMRNSVRELSPKMVSVNGERMMLIRPRVLAGGAGAVGGAGIAIGRDEEYWKSLGEMGAKTKAEAGVAVKRLVVDPLAAARARPVAQGMAVSSVSSMNNLNLSSDLGENEALRQAVQRSGLAKSPLLVVPASDQGISMAMKGSNVMVKSAPSWTGGRVAKEYMPVYRSGYSEVPRDAALNLSRTGTPGWTEYVEKSWTGAPRPTQFKWYPAKGAISWSGGPMVKWGEGNTVRMINAREVQ